MSDIAIRTEKLSKKYRVGVERARYGRLTESLWNGLATPFRRQSRNGGLQKEVWALKDVSLEVRQGEVVGIIGRNGAGKTTLLKLLSRITEPTSGYAEIRGRVGSLLEVGTGFHPELTGRDNIYLSGAILGMRRSEIARKFGDIVQFSEVEAFLDTPVKRYSSGMQVRLAFAVAAHLDPEILLVDEVLAVGDLAFQQKCTGKIGDAARSGRTVLFVTHNMASLRNLCTQAMLLEHGDNSTIGGVDQVVSTYLKSLESIDSSNGDLTSVPRTGTGAVRFRRISFESKTGEPISQVVTGEALDVELEYESTRERHTNVILSVNFSDQMGNRLFACTSGALPKPIELAYPQGIIRCRIPRLPLLPGRYCVEGLVKVDGRVADWISPIANLQVVAGDFFGSGKLPSSRTGPILIDFDWLECDGYVR